VVHVDRTDLNQGVMTVLPPDRVEGNEDAIPQVACGYVAPSQWATIVEPHVDEATGEHDGTGRELPEGKGGESWLYGTNVGRAYWAREDEARGTVRNGLTERVPEGTRPIRELGEGRGAARESTTSDSGEGG